jgi:hypothetical protein
MNRARNPPMGPLEPLDLSPATTGFCIGFDFRKCRYSAELIDYAAAASVADSFDRLEAALAAARIEADRRAYLAQLPVASAGSFITVGG